jgi:hypothetical protein
MAQVVSSEVTSWHGSPRTSKRQGGLRRDLAAPSCGTSLLLCAEGHQTLRAAGSRPRNCSASCIRRGDFQQGTSEGPYPGGARKSKRVASTWSQVAARLRFGIPGSRRTTCRERSSQRERYCPSLMPSKTPKPHEGHDQPVVPACAPSGAASWLCAPSGAAIPQADPQGSRSPISLLTP